MIKLIFYTLLNQYLFQAFISWNLLWVFQLSSWPISERVGLLMGCILNAVVILLIINIISLYKDIKN